MRFNLQYQLEIRITAQSRVYCLNSYFESLLAEPARKPVNIIDVVCESANGDQKKKKHAAFSRRCLYFSSVPFEN